MMKSIRLIAPPDRAAHVGTPSSSRREIEQRYSGLMQISGEAVVIVRDALIVFANEPACELLGLTPECHRLGLPFLNFISPGQRLAVRAQLKDERQFDRRSRSHDGRATPPTLG